MAGLDDVIAMLDRVIGGQEISLQEVQSLRWSVKSEHDALVQRIYRNLQMYASDADIRKRDSDYSMTWRDAFSTFRKELLSLKNAI